MKFFTFGDYFSYEDYKLDTRYLGNFDKKIFLKNRLRKGLYETYYVRTVIVNWYHGTFLYLLNRKWRCGFVILFTFYAQLKHNDSSFHLGN